MPENRRRFQFGLRTLLLMLTGAAALCSLAATTPRLFCLFVVMLGLLLLTGLVVAGYVFISIGIANALWWLLGKAFATGDAEVEENAKD